jgi:hypothetical protein
MIGEGTDAGKQNPKPSLTPPISWANVPPPLGVHSLGQFHRRVSDLLKQGYNGIILFMVLFSAAIIITDTINHRFSQTDFRFYVQGAEWLLQGENLYNRIEGVAKVPYKYSPFAAFFFTPFLLFSLEVSVAGLEKSLRACNYPNWVLSFPIWE